MLTRAIVYFAPGAQKNEVLNQYPHSVFIKSIAQLGDLRQLNHPQGSVTFLVNHEELITVLEEALEKYPAAKHYRVLLPPT